MNFLIHSTFNLTNIVLWRLAPCLISHGTTAWTPVIVDKRRRRQSRTRQMFVDTYLEEVSLKWTNKKTRVSTCHKNVNTLHRMINRSLDRYNRSSLCDTRHPYNLLTARPPLNSRPPYSVPRYYGYVSTNTFDILLYTIEVNLICIFYWIISVFTFL